jgi:hypothetical protein
VLASAAAAVVFFTFRQDPSNAAPIPLRLAELARESGQHGKAAERLRELLAV